MANDVIDTLSIKINASAASAIQSVDQLEKALTRLQKTVSKLSNTNFNFGGTGGGGGGGLTRISAGFEAASMAASAFSKAFTATGSVVSKIAGKVVNGFSNIASGALNAVSSVKSLADSFLELTAGTNLAGFIKESVQYGANITEIDHIVESVYGNMSSAVQNFAKDAIHSYGIAEAAAKQYSGYLSAMFQSSGLDYETAGEMGMNLTALAGDLAAFYNIDVETAFEKIRSGMAGMVRPLRSIGIDLTAATLSEYAMAQGIQKSYSEMTQAEKVMLRYNYLLTQTKTQQGDFTRTAESMANASRTLRANMDSLKTSIGEGFVAAIRPMVVALNGLMGALIKAAQAFAVFMQTLTGGKYKGAASGIAMAMEDADGLAEDLAGGVEEAADGLGGAADNAKKLRKELSVLPFDELNQLNKDRESLSSGSGSGGGSGGGSGAADFGLVDGMFDWRDFLGDELADAINAWAKKIRSAFLKHDWVELGATVARGLNTGLGMIWDVIDPQKVESKIVPFIDAFTISFNSLIDNLNFPLLGAVIGGGITDIVLAFERLVNGINWTRLGTQLARGANGLVKTVNFAKVGQLLGARFMIVWDILSGFVHKFDWDKLGDQLGIAVNNWNVRVDFSKIADALATGLNGAFKSLFAFTKRVNWGQIAQNVVNGINKFVSTFDWVSNGKALNKFIQDMLDTLVSIAKGSDWQGLGSGIGAALSQIQWGEALKKVFETLKEVLGGIWKGLGETSAGSFIRAIILFKIGSRLLPFINSIVRSITGYNATTIISVGITTLFRKAFSALSATSVAGALKGFFVKIGTFISTHLGSAITNGFSTLLGGLLGAVATFGGLVLAGFKTWKSEYMTIAKDATDLADNLQANMERSAQSIESSFSSSIAEIDATESAARPFLNTLRDLEGQTELTATEQYALKTAIGGLNDLYPTLGLNIDAVTGALNMSVDEVENFIESSRKMAEAEAYFEVAKQYYKDAALAAETATEVEKKYDIAVERRNNILAAQDVVKRRSTMTEAEFRKALEKTGARIDEMGNIVDSMGVSYESWDTSLRHANAAVDEAKIALDEANGIVEEHTAKADEAATKYSELSGEAESMSDAIRRSLDLMTESSASYEGLGAMIEDLGKKEVLSAEQIEHMNAVLEYAKSQNMGTGEAYRLVSDELLNLGSTTDTTMEQIIAAQQEAQAAMDEYVEGVRGAMSQNIDAFAAYQEGAANVFEQVKESGELSVEDWKANLEEQIKATHEWEENLVKLTEMGIDKGFLQEIINAGPDAYEFTKQMVEQGSEAVKEMSDTYVKAMDAANMSDEMGTKLENAMRDAFGELPTLGEDAAAATIDGYSDGVDKNLSTAATATDKLAYDAVEMRFREKLEWHSPSKLTERAGRGVVQGLKNGLTDTTKVSTVKKAANDLADYIKSPFKDINTDFGTIATDIADAIATGLRTASASISTAGSDVAVTLIGGIKSGYSLNSGMINEVISSIRGAFSFSLYSEGQAVGQSFANGIQSVRIQTPHMRVAGYTPTVVGKSSISIPRFAIDWYEHGGLFKGGEGQIIGIAENFKDEAVLPLSDHRAMSQIADAIAGSGGLGMNDEFAQIVADAVVEAWARNPQYIDFTNETVLKVGEEAIARSVERGQKKLNQRFNPVAQPT